MPRGSHSNSSGVGRFIGHAVLITLLAVVCLVGGWVLGSLKPLPFLPREAVGTASSQAEQPAPSSSAPEEPSSVPVSSQASSAPEGQEGMPDDNGLFSAYYDYAYAKMETMSVADLVGQVFIFRCPVNGAVKLIDDCQPAGYCLMADFFEPKTADQVRSTLASYNNSSRTNMFFCCDEEGGTVVRISRCSQFADQPFRSPRDVFAEGGFDAIESDTKEKASLLKSLGLNMNLAPVADVSTNPQDFIYDRAFGQDAAGTAEFVRLSVETYRASGIACTLKHFPGYGNNADTHTGLAYDNRPMETFESSDFIPFRAGIEAKAPFVLVSHNVVSCMDPDAPASLSPAVHEILREELGFTGLILTDDLVMDAVTDFTGGKSAAVQAFLAGNDLLLSSDCRNDYQALYDAVESGEVPMATLKEAVVRVLAAKYALGIV